MNTVNNAKRNSKVIIYCMGTLDEMVQYGLLTQGSLMLSKNGREDYKQLIEEGFCPTEEEFKNGIKHIQDECIKSGTPFIYCSDIKMH